MRWLEILEEFSFDVEHRPENRRMNAHALSRRPCRLKTCVCHQEESENGINTNQITVSAVTLRSKRKSNSRVGPTTDGDVQDETGEENNSAFPEPGVAGKVESPQDLLWSWDGLREAQERDPAIGLSLIHI